MGSLRSGDLGKKGAWMFKPKIWLRLGALAVASSTTALIKPILATETQEQSKEAAGQPGPTGTVVAQSGLRGGGGEGGEGVEGGEAGTRRPAVTPKLNPQPQQKPKVKQRGGFGGEGGEGGERGSGRRSERAPRWGDGGEAGERGVNTRYIFGFTEGADTERAREKEFENDTQGRLGKRSGTYTALQNTNNLLAEVGVFGSYHRIQDVPDFEDRNNARFDGAFAEVKYRFLNRNIHGIGMAFSVEPEWHRYSDLTGRFENSYAVELKLYADKELIPGRLFIAGNLVYEPEAVLAKEFDADTGQFTKWERESSFQAQGAISGAVTPDLFLGAEVRYLAQYEGSFLNHLEGRALYAGPTLYARLSSKSTITLAYSWQVSGKAIEQPDQRLDLLNFERQQFRVRWVSEFATV
jgi:hypothetical protein